MIQVVIETPYSTVVHIGAFIIRVGVRRRFVVESRYSGALKKLRDDYGERSVFILIPV